MSLQINVGGEAAKRVKQGKAVMLAVLFYLVDSDELQFVFPDGIDKEENWAIIANFIEMKGEKSSRWSGQTSGVGDSMAKADRTLSMMEIHPELIRLRRERTELFRRWIQIYGLNPFQNTQQIYMAGLAQYPNPLLGLLGDIGSGIGQR